MREMQKVSEVFKSNLNYYQHVANKKLTKKNALLDFQVTVFLAGGPFLKFTHYSRNSLIEKTKMVKFMVNNLVNLDIIG
jgi:hypothetical protein